MRNVDAVFSLCTVYSWSKKNYISAVMVVKKGNNLRKQSASPEYCISALRFTKRLLGDLTEHASSLTRMLEMLKMMSSDGGSSWDGGEDGDSEGEMNCGKKRKGAVDRKTKKKAWQCNGEGAAFFNCRETSCSSCPCPDIRILQR